MRGWWDVIFEEGGMEIEPPGLSRIEGNVSPPQHFHFPNSISKIAPVLWSLDPRHSVFQVSITHVSLCSFPKLSCPEAYFASAFLQALQQTRSG